MEIPENKLAPVQAPERVSEWFYQRSYRREQFEDLALLSRRKRERGLSVSVVLPARNVADTIGGIIDATRSLNAAAGTRETGRIVDQVLVIDADSPDGTAEVARERGAEVYSENELLPEYGPALGKGDAMWRSLSVVRGDILVFADSDTRDFEAQFISGILGPLLLKPELRFVKAAYRRPFRKGEEVTLDGGGRVTELSTKPLFNLFYPELAGFVQPLAGEFAAPADLYRSIPFFTGYAVETGMMIDVLRLVGLDAMAQVDLGTRQNRHQPLFDLGQMAYSVVQAAARRLPDLPEAQPPGGLYPPASYFHAAAAPEGLQLREHAVEVVERPPFRELR